MDKIISLLENNTSLFVASNIITTSLSISYILYKRKQRNELARLRPTRLVVITGCDSGLGLSMALWARQLGYPVLAGCLNPDGEGANLLKKEGVTISRLDVTKAESINDFQEACTKVLEETKTKLWAVVSNAAVLVCAEVLWQTQSQWERQFAVNFWGAVHLTKQFQPLLFQHKSRFIIISSDCSKLALPGLSMYAASKAALESWGRGLRLEFGKYGVTVVSYQPGSFAFSSQIFAGSATHYAEMEKNMSPLDKEFYGDYFTGWKRLKAQLSEQLPSVQPLKSKRHQKDLKLLLEGNLSRTPVVTYETWVQLVLLWGEKLLPRALSDKLLTFTMNGAVDVFWKPMNYAKLCRKFVR